MMPNPCTRDCAERSCVCHADCKRYEAWRAERKAANQALRDAEAPDEVRRNSYFNYKRKAEPHKKVRMYLHK